jgi:hypothetical protein
MRFYGIRSGRNNMSRMIARSIMYNTPKRHNSVVKKNDESDEALNVAILMIAIVCIIIIVL